MAIEVSEKTGVSGFVLPDHRVDVVQIGPPVAGQSEAETVLQDVLVLASGQTFTRPDDRSLQSRTVTLALTPEQVDTVVGAQLRGPLSLSLRGLNDHTHMTVVKKEKEGGGAAPPPRSKEEIVAVKPPEPKPEPIPEPPLPPPPPPARYVTLYRGLDNIRRVRIDQPIDSTMDELAAASSKPAPPSEN